jgi:hypothetical protein
MSRRLGTAVFVLIAIGISLSLAIGSTIHNLVSHDHHGGESAWSSLHGSLHHDDKKLSLAVLDLTYLASFGVALFFIYTIALPAFTTERARGSLFAHDAALRRGIFAYRKFK